MDERVEPMALATVAERAVRAAGEYLAGGFRDGAVDADYRVDDVKAAADRAAEARIIEIIEETYPEHGILAEESGEHDGGPYQWVVDPLDGTNNYASGLPAFASAVAVLDGGDPVVSAIYEPLPESLYLAVDGEGATVNGRPLAAGSDVPVDRGTVSLVRGVETVRDPALHEQAEAIETALRSRTKRVVETWSPCVDWGLLARGAIEGLVTFHPDVYEQYAGALLAEESRVVAREREHVYVGAGDEETLDVLAAQVEAALEE